MPKNTADLVALILAGIVAVVVIITTFALLYNELTNPENTNPARAAEAISRIISVLVAALVGFMAGRRVNGNGH